MYWQFCGDMFFYLLMAMLFKNIIWGQLINDCHLQIED